jgi:hypothetical protein
MPSRVLLDLVGSGYTGLSMMSFVMVLTRAGAYNGVSDESFSFCTYFRISAILYELSVHAAAVGRRTSASPPATPTL